MPILAPELDCYPPDLFDPVDRTAGIEERSWWLVYSRSRREKDLMRRLARSGVPFYGPTVSRRSRAPSGRVRESFVLLFPGYVFVFGSAEERHVALQTNCVSAVTLVPDPERLVEDLRRVRGLIAANVPVTAEARLQAGARVRVVSGPLRGQEGVVIERRGRRRLLVSVQLLQQGASADLDECDVQSV